MDRRSFNKLAALSGVGVLLDRPSFARATSAHAGPKAPIWRSGYMLGTSYYPEWWQPEEWETDFAQMAALGLNTVRMGEFAWAAFEPEPGKFTFGWMDRAIEIAHRHGLDVVLGTPTAAVPPWLYAQHPDVLGASAVAPYSYGGRKGYCVNSANYLDASARIVQALAEHYGRHPGVIGWQLDNEPGIPFECLDHNCEHAFQRWLQRKYGSVAELNRVWNGAFWSNQYSDWSQIHFPKNSAEGGWQPAITLDYRKFFSDSYLNHLRRQAEILRKNGPDQFIATNWPTVNWSVDTYKAASEFLDMTSWDNYVSAPGLTDFRHQYISCMNDDMSRSASRDQRYFCAEQIAYLPPNALPEGLRLQAYLNLAHGSHGHLYFEWRRPLAGNEQSRPSFIKGFDGAITPLKPVFEQIGREFRSLGPRLHGAVTRADVALLYDFTNEFAQGFWSVGQPTERYDGGASRSYAGLKSLQRNVDIVPLKADLSPYKVLVAPNLRLIDDAGAAKLERYVANGGVLVLSPRSGTQNVDGSMRRAVAPGVFEQMAGVSVDSRLDLTEYSSARGQMDEAHETELGIKFDGADVTFRPRVIIESLVLHGAEVVARIHGGRMDGRPAVVRNRHGRGWVVYQGADSGDHAFHEAVLRVATEPLKLQPLLDVPNGVVVTTREDEQHLYTFLLNLTETPHRDIALPRRMADLLNSEREVSSVSLEPLGVAVLCVRK